jgi:serine/tyrosine/threonine adenylyltransferase
MILENDYHRLPQTLYTAIDPSPVTAPELIKFNEPLASELQLDLHASDEQLAQLFSGNEKLPGSEPIALAYAGHQFGNFVPRLGDGRAVLLGEARDRKGILRDLQLKGAGRTLYSRGGDGRAALGPVLREYLVSEAMTAMGVPSTRSLAAVLTGERVQRGPTSLPGAVLTRVATSHVRVGTFEYLRSRDDIETLKRLADYMIARHYPAAMTSDAPYLRFLDEVVERQAFLIAEWMRVGFIHGVMNTDNTSIVGETIDYGPCAFLDSYDPGAVFSSIDHAGRYSFSNQPGIAQWNLARLAETLLPLIDADTSRAVERATESITRFSALFREARIRVFRAKIGLQQLAPTDAELITELLSIMHRAQADYTLTFHALGEHMLARPPTFAVQALFDSADFQAWLRAWAARCEVENISPIERGQLMSGVNPVYVPRNHRIEQVIEAAVIERNFDPFERLLRVGAQPYVEHSEYAQYALPPRPEERVLETFCGT